MSASWSKVFADPGSEWRSAPFWSWNERLTPEEARRQIRSMHAAGMGGFFMHARYGLETEYLGPEFMEVVRACVDEARKLRMQAWLYDEDRWPSGAAGSLATGPHPEFRARYLLRAWPEHEVPAGGEPVAAFDAVEEGQTGRLTHLARLGEGEEARVGKRLAFYACTQAPRGWHNGAAYLDTPDEEAVAEFIRAGYEPYAKAVGEDFGRLVPGIFTDEPNHSGDGPRTLPWSRRFREAFRERFGYDVAEVLPHLFYDVAADRARVNAARWDYHELLTDLFVTNFSGQIGKWCEARGLALTGHMLGEQSLAGQTRVVGAAMRHYEPMQAPGIDILGEKIAEVLTCKQVASVARQCGRERVLSELYGGNTWAFSFEGMKWVGDWQYALGVNLRCEHLTLWSLRGGRKRDYPPSFFEQSPWWPDYPLVCDYFARLSYMLTRGEAVRDVLVVHPVESAWLTCRPNASGAVETFDRALATTMDALLDAHHDFDLGDEEMLSRLGSVKGKELRVGRAAYRLAIVPECLTLRSSTVDLLTKFADAGGPVLFLGRAPEFLSGRPDPDGRIARLLAHERVARTANDPAAIASAVSSRLARRVSIADADGRECPAVLYQLRRDGRRRVVFLVNTDRERGVDGTVTLEGSGRLEAWDAQTGEASPLACETAKGSVRFPVKLAAAGSALFVLDAGGRAARPKPAPARRVLGEEAIRGPWRFERLEPNALVLDFCRWRLDGGEWSERMPVRQAEREIKSALGITLSPYNNDVQPWKAEKRDLGRTVELALEFEVRDMPHGAVELVIEEPARWRVTLNEMAIPSEDRGPFVDQAFRRLHVTGWLWTGRNEVRMACDAHTLLEVEDAYLVGDFGVDLETRAVVREPKMLDIGDWTTQGLPFYTGKLVLRAAFKAKKPARGERLELDLGRPLACLARVRVNGKDLGARAWCPWTFDLTGAVKGGKNELEIELTPSRMNLLGPRHYANLEKGWCVGPPHFYPQPGRWTDQYLLVAQGLAAPPRLRRLARG